jgi:hypothetical protein
MQLVRRFGGQVRRAFPATVLTAAMILASACGTEQENGAGPTLPGNPPPNPTITRAAFLADVNARTGEVKIRPPELTGTQGGLLRGASDSDGNSVELSLVGGDVVTLTSSNFVASAVGAFDPGKIRVTFDINVTNKLNGVQLVGPTVFPAPPAGTTGPLLFPFDISVAVTSGGTATGGQGNDIIVTLPSYGLVAPAITWDGAPHNFFNDVGCVATSNDCFRWEEYPGPIFPGSTTIARSVGFDIDPTVGQFTARLLVAADLQNSGAAPTGTIAGTVTSPQLGTLNGVTLTATSGITSLPATTAGAGAYSIASVPTGPASVAITAGLPAGCTAPAAQNTTVANAATSTIDFTVTCPVPVGSVTGTVSFTGSTPSATGISVVVTPTGGSAQAAVNPNASGLYTRSNVPVGTGAGSVVLSNLPAGCTNPGAGSYTGLIAGGSATVNFTVACTPAPSGYQYTGTAVDGGATVTISFSINMASFDEPVHPGAEQIGVIDGTFTYPAARLGSPSCSYPAGSALSSPVPPSTGTPGLAAGFGTTPVITCTFSDLGGATAISTTTTLSVASDSNGELDYLPNIIVTEATAP